MLSKKIITSIASMVLISTLAGCGGLDPRPPGSDDKATVYFSMTGIPSNSRWDCAAKIEISPGNREIKLDSAGSKSGSVNLKNGVYEADIDVSCGCRDAPSGCAFAKAWGAGISIYSSIAPGSKRIEIPSKSQRGYKATERITVTGGELRKQLSLSNAAELKSNTANSVDDSNLMYVDLKLLDYKVKDEKEVVLCDLRHAKAYYGGFGFHNVAVENKGSTAISGWNAYIDFGEGIPDPQWSVGATVKANGTGILVSGDDVLEPGEVVNFSVGGQYKGENVLDILCY